MSSVVLRIQGVRRAAELYSLCLVFAYTVKSKNKKGPHAITQMVENFLSFQRKLKILKNVEASGNISVTARGQNV